MVMDPHFSELSDSVNGFEFGDNDVFPYFDRSEARPNTFRFGDNYADLNFLNLPSISTDLVDPGYVAPITSTRSEVDSPDDSDASDDVLKYINSILMEENIEQKASMFHDPLALQAAEKSFYDVLGGNYPASPNQPPLYFNQNHESHDYSHVFCTSSEQSTNSSTSGSNCIDSPWIVDPGEAHKPSVVQSYPLGYNFESDSQTNSQLSFFSVRSSSDDVSSPILDSSLSSTPSQLVSNIFSDSESVLQFKRGVEEASKFLPTNNQLVIDLDSYAMPPELKGGTSEAIVKVEKGDKELSSNTASRGRKNHYREDSTLDERSSKQSAVYVDEAELSEMFDKVLLFTSPSCCNDAEQVQSEESMDSQQNGKTHRSGSGKTRAKRLGNKKEVVDLTTLLINCAQSVAADDSRSANEQLKQIRQHSSPSGDGSQRLAHIVANGLEARLAGTGSQIYASLATKRISAAEKLKAFQLYFSACPFMKMSIFFAGGLIFDLAMESPKKKLHIIDFGISYGFQWPAFFQFLAALPGGALELRVTGIDFPQPGFRPAELLEETGHRLAKYCQRFNVPFQYHAIAQKWETIQIEDLNVDRDELLVVNCFFGLENLHDDTVVEENPKDAVLKLIRKMNPDIFTHSVTNGSYNSPYFVTRFREALFHYSSLFDMFDANIPREDQERANFEKEFYGREVMNVIACEGLERVVRPETYKQWHIRTVRAGFKILPLKQHILQKGKMKVKGYHKDFLSYEDSQWFLQGWKGRIVYANSCWIPA